MAGASASLVRAFSLFSRNRTGDIGLSLSLQSPIDAGTYSATLDRIKSIIPDLQGISFDNVVSKEEKVPFPVGKDDASSQVQLSFVHFGRGGSPKNMIYRIPNSPWRLLAISEPEPSLSFILMPFNEKHATEQILTELGTLLFKWVTDSPEFYTSLLRKTILIEINKLLGSPDLERLDLSKITHSTTLSYSQLRTGGLVGGRDQYAVSINEDGTRVLLYVSTSGIFLVSSSVFKYLSKTDSYPDSAKPFLLDCRLIPVENRIGKARNLAKTLLVADDCLAFGGSSVISEPLLYRQGLIGQIINVNDQRIALIKKMFIPFVTPKDFFAATSQMAEHVKNVYYINSGLIFVPTGPYLERTDADGRKRRQTLYVWRNDTITIDVMYNDGKWYIHSDKTENKLREFAYDVKMPDLMFDNGVIYELKYDLSDNIWQVSRKRSDRFRPNNEYQEAAIIETINDPITWDTLTGNNFDLYLHYHRREKKTLFSYPVNFYKRDLSLLSIGCSRGGDLERWMKYSRIGALEPIKDCLQKLFELAEEIENTPDITLYQNSEDGDLNIQETFDVISIMFSIGRYCKTAEMLSNFISSLDRLLNPGGFVLITMLDANSLRALFDLQDSDDIVFSDASRIRKIKSDDAVELAVNLNIGDGRVVKRNDYPISANILVDILGQVGIHPIKTWVLDRESFMSDQEYFISRLYSCWIFRKEGTLPEQVAPKTSKKAAPKTVTQEKGDVQCMILNPSEVQYKGKLDISKPEQKYAELEAVGQIGDGSCFIHTILYALEEDYVKMTTSKKQKRAREVREDLANSLTEEEYAKLAVSKIGGKESSRQAIINRLKNSREFIQDEDMEYIARQININLIFYTCDTKKGLQLYKGGIYMIDQKYDWVPVLWVSETHFELLREIGKENFVYYKTPLASYFRGIARKYLNN